MNGLNTYYQRLPLFIVVNYIILTFYVVNSNVIESNGEGSYCINRIPRRGIPTNCTSDSVCEEMLGIPIQDGNYLRCGEQGECITKQFPKNEHCKDACDNNNCSKFCLQEYETKTAMYCIETRDHPNAMPINNEMNSTGFQNKFYCTCVLAEGAPYRHRVVSRYLHYRL